MAVQTRVQGSVLEFLDDRGNVIAAFDGAARSLTIPAGATFDGAIATADIADDSVTNAKIAADAVSPTELATDAVESAKIKGAAVTKAKLAGGFAHVDVVAGVNETVTPSIAVSGIAVGDELIAVIVFVTTDAVLATMTKRANADFTIAAGALSVGANAANNTDNQYLIIWNDLT